MYYLYVYTYIHIHILRTEPDVGSELVMFKSSREKKACGSHVAASVSGMKNIWEFPKIGDPNIVP